MLVGWLSGLRAGHGWGGAWRTFIRIFFASPFALLAGAAVIVIAGLISFAAATLGT
ncbi:MAG: hypothetical protein R3F37_07360 [Candidatus Competibacteraceae bacterium]